jgi:5'-deoxynucleotidase YfbR-like HD superfamily hydrolase
MPPHATGTLAASYGADGKIDLDKPESRHVTLMNILPAICRLPRYNARGRTGFTVAQHSLTVSAMVVDRFVREEGVDSSDTFMPDKIATVAWAALWHDAHEALIGDQTRPFVCTMEKRNPGFKAALDQLKAEWDAVIGPKFGIMPETFSHPYVRDADLQVCLWEMKHEFLGLPTEEFGLPPHIMAMGMAPIFTVGRFATGAPNGDMSASKVQAAFVNYARGMVQMMQPDHPAARSWHSLELELCNAPDLPHEYLDETGRAAVRAAGRLLGGLH